MPAPDVSLRDHDLPTGLADPVSDAQRIFRAVLAAMAEPGTLHRLPATGRPPAGLPWGLAALALTLADLETPLWLDPQLARDAAIVHYLRFHTGAPIVADCAAAQFALVCDPGLTPPIAACALGSAEYPDTSTTVVVAVSGIAAVETGGLVLTGPGIPGRRRLEIAPLPAGFVAARSANAALFPRGVDHLFVAGDTVCGLPRTTRIEG